MERKRLLKELVFLLLSMAGCPRVKSHPVSNVGDTCMVYQGSSEGDESGPFPNMYF